MYLFVYVFTLCVISFLGGTREVALWCVQCASWCAIIWALWL